MSASRILLCAGGTGGHVFPAEALAGELLERGHELVLMTDRRGEAYGGALGSLQTYSLPAGAIAGRGVLGRLRGVIALAIGSLQARGHIKKIQPSVVVGFGGYASVPGVLAGIWAKLPTVLHEQNAVLGRANKLLAPKVSRVATSFKDVLGAPRGNKTVMTGMPVRANILAISKVPYPAPDKSGPLRLLVTGGSQGARIFSEVVPGALSRLPEELRKRIEISQQCRPEDLEEVRTLYKEAGITAACESFFKDVPERLAKAHLVIARAGASTVAELTTAGRPAILVPYPHATDDHQTANAHAFDEAGAGWLMPQDTFTAQSLAARLEGLLALPATLEKTAACAARAGHPDAAVRLADLVVSLIPGDTP